jgi:hypothetical protein
LDEKMFFGAGALNGLGAMVLGNGHDETVMDEDDCMR